MFNILNYSLLYVALKLCLIVRIRAGKSDPFSVPWSLNMDGKLIYFNETTLFKKWVTVTIVTEFICLSICFLQHGLHEGICGSLLLLGNVDKQLCVFWHPGKRCWRAKPSTNLWFSFTQIFSYIHEQSDHHLQLCNNTLVRNGFLSSDVTCCPRGRSKPSPRCLMRTCMGCLLREGRWELLFQTHWTEKSDCVTDPFLTVVSLSSNKKTAFSHLHMKIELQVFW